MKIPSTGKHPELPPHAFARALTWPRDFPPATALANPLVPLHRGWTVSSSTEDWEVLGLDQNLNAACDARGPPDETGAFEGEHHLMDAGWRDLEVPLHVAFRGRLAEDTA